MIQDNQYEFHNFQQERQQRLEQAIINAENYQATQEDFDIIRVETGMKRKEPCDSSLMMKDIFNDFASIFGDR